MASRKSKAMDIVRIVAERKIEEAIDRGDFDALPSCGRIDCSLHGEKFLAKWFREKFQREDQLEPPLTRKLGISPSFPDI
jgi:hypothetical protein